MSNRLISVESNKLPNLDLLENTEGSHPENYRRIDPVETTRRSPFKGKDGGIVQALSNKWC